MQSTILIEGLEFYAFHGATDAEQEIGHRYRADLTLEVEQTASETDRVRDTVDYGSVMQLVIAICTENQFRTVERLCFIVCTGILEEFGRVNGIECYMRKIMPPAPFIAEQAGVHLRMER